METNEVDRYLIPILWSKKLRDITGNRGLLIYIHLRALELNVPLHDKMHVPISLFLMTLAIEFLFPLVPHSSPLGLLHHRLKPQTLSNINLNRTHRTLLPTFPHQTDSTTR